MDMTGLFLGVGDVVLGLPRSSLDLIAALVCNVFPIAPCWFKHEQPKAPILRKVLCPIGGIS